MKACLLSPVLHAKDPLFQVPYVGASPEARGTKGLAPELVLAIGFALFHSLDAGEHRTESLWSEEARRNGIAQRLSTGV